MIKANVVLPDGGKVTIQGSPDEVAQILAKLSSPQTESGEPRTQKRVRRRKKPGAASKPGPTQYILELRDEKFFKAKRKLLDIQKKLEERGHIYARTTLSPILVRLIRKRKLRRLKEKKGWVYVS